VDPSRVEPQGHERTPDDSCPPAAAQSLQRVIRLVRGKHQQHQVRERTAAHSTPRRAQPSRRLRSYFLRVKTARVMTTGKISSPVNFDSAAAAKAVPKRSALDGEGSVQISPSCYKARSVNNITGTLVITSGPKVRKVGVVT